MLDIANLSCSCTIRRRTYWRELLHLHGLRKHMEWRRSSILTAMGKAGSAIASGENSMVSTIYWYPGIIWDFARRWCCPEAGLKELDGRCPCVLNGKTSLCLPLKWILEKRYNMSLCEEIGSDLNRVNKRQMQRNNHAENFYL